jgi:hypothetical protein
MPFGIDLQENILGLTCVIKVVEGLVIDPKLERIPVLHDAQRVLVN